MQGRQKLAAMVLAALAPVMGLVLPPSAHAMGPVHAPHLLQPRPNTSTSGLPAGSLSTPHWM